MRDRDLDISCGGVQSNGPLAQASKETKMVNYQYIVDQAEDYAFDIPDPTYNFFIQHLFRDKRLAVHS